MDLLLRRDAGVREVDAGGDFQFEGRLDVDVDVRAGLSAGWVKADQTGFSDAGLLLGEQRDRGDQSEEDDGAHGSGPGDVGLADAMMTVIGRIGRIRRIGPMIRRIGRIGRMLGLLIGLIRLIRLIIGPIRRIRPICPIPGINKAIASGI